MVLLQEKVILFLLHYSKLLVLSIIENNNGYIANIGNMYLKLLTGPMIYVINNNIYIIIVMLVILFFLYRLLNKANNNNHNGMEIENIFDTIGIPSKEL